MSLVESTRQWVLTNLPYDRGDAALVAYLAGLDAHGLSCRLLGNWILPAGEAPTSGWFTSRGPFKENPLATRRANDLCPDHARTSSTGENSKNTSAATLIALPQKHPERGRPDLDLLLNNWGVHHLHISSIVEPDGFVKRDGPLLFVSFTFRAA